MTKGSISLRCVVLDLSRDTYYAFPKRQRIRQKRDREIVDRLRLLAKAKKFKLGIQTLTMAYTRTYHEPINHKKVARLKREYDIPTKIRTRRYAKPQQPKLTEHMIIAENSINRNFNVPSPYQAAGTDVTYLWIPKLCQFAYLANVRDMATGEYLGWDVSFLNDQCLADGAVLDMRHRHVRTFGLMLHSDRGGTYTSEHFQKDIVLGHDLIPSMSRKGNCIDNAPTESGHGHLKDWFDFTKCTTLQEIKAEIDRVIHYFNEERPQWQRKKMTPVEYRDHLLSST